MISQQKSSRHNGNINCKLIQPLTALNMPSTNKPSPQTLSFDTSCKNYRSTQSVIDTPALMTALISHNCYRHTPAWWTLAYLTCTLAYDHQANSCNYCVNKNIHQTKNLFWNRNMKIFHHSSTAFIGQPCIISHRNNSTNDTALNLPFAQNRQTNSRHYCFNETSIRRRTRYGNIKDCGHFSIAFTGHPCTARRMYQQRIICVAFWTHVMNSKHITWKTGQSIYAIRSDPIQEKAVACTCLFPLCIIHDCAQEQNHIWEQTWSCMTEAMTLTSYGNQNSNPLHCLPLLHCDFQTGPATQGALEAKHRIKKQKSHRKLGNQCVQSELLQYKTSRTKKATSHENLDTARK